MRYAIIFPGNLASYFVSLDTLEKISNNYNVDIYILYSKNINYIHSLFDFNIDININEVDIEYIKSRLKNNIKYFKAIEDISDYDNIINEKINLFQKNIFWAKDFDIKLLGNFDYDSFLNNNRTKIYLDQFVRINYLYKIIEDSQINYDYIIRARIDQYIDYDILNNIIISLNSSTDYIYPVISCNMDNFFIIGKTHFNFFNYLINNIGSEELNYRNKDYYILGPEIQFIALIDSFFPQIYNFNDFNIYFQITFAILDLNINKIFTYNRINIGSDLCFSNYISKKEEIMGIKLNKTNYLQFLENDKAFIEKDFSLFENLKKYYDITTDKCILFYSLIIYTLEDLNFGNSSKNPDELLLLDE